jgi:hypothetical protein
MAEDQASKPGEGMQRTLKVCLIVIIDKDRQGIYT